MADEREAPGTKRQARVGNRKNHPRSFAIAERGIETGPDFARFMSALIGDIVARRVSPDIGNAACNAGGKLLKVVEMQFKYGSRAGSSGEVLALTSGGE